MVITIIIMCIFFIALFDFNCWGHYGSFVGGS